MLAHYIQYKTLNRVCQVLYDLMNTISFICTVLKKLFGSFAVVLGKSPQSVLQWAFALCHRGINLVPP